MLAYGAVGDNCESNRLSPRPEKPVACGSEQFCSDVRRIARYDNHRWVCAARPPMKANAMAVPSILQGESRTRLLQGIALGVIATLVVGFSWGGWVTGGTAKSMAATAETNGKMSVLVPLCVTQFMATGGAVAKLKLTQYVHRRRRSKVREEGRRHRDGLQLRQGLCVRYRRCSHENRWKGLTEVILKLAPPCGAPVALIVTFLTCLATCLTSRP